MFPFTVPQKRLFAGLREEDLKDPRAHTHAVAKAEVLARVHSPRLDAALVALKLDLTTSTLAPFEEAAQWAVTLKCDEGDDE